MPTVLITGCSSGIGLDAARHLSGRGWSVIATCRRPEDLAARRAEGMQALHLDLAEEASVADCVARALALGPVDALVNNAAFALPGAVEDLPRGGLRAIFEANLFGTHDLTRRLIPHFRDRGAGRIVNVSSVLGLVGIPWRGAYVATKFALEGLSESLAAELAPLGISVTIAEPGGLRTQWAGTSMQQSPTRMEDYEQTAGKRRDATLGVSGRQPGDPVRAAAAIATAVDAGTPPLRLLLGSDALAGARARLDRLRHEIDANEALTRSADLANV